jgi:uncharacterized protein YjgD (DUF1641 family)
MERELMSSQLDRIEAKLDHLQAALDRAGPLLDLLAKHRDFLEQLPGYLATVGDSFDDMVAVGRMRGIDPEVMLRGLFESGLLETRSVELLAGAAAELPRAATAPSEEFGLVKLIRVLREDEVQRALSFLIHFTRRFGRLLDELDQK